MSNNLFGKFFKNFGFFCVWLLLPSITYASMADVKGLRIWPSPGSTRVVFDLNKSVQYKVYTLTSPNRVVVDLQDVQFNVNVKQVALRNTNINNLRVGKQDNKNTRIVFETATLLKPNSFLLTPNEKYGYRLVVDLESSEKQSILALFDLDQIKNGAPTQNNKKYVGQSMSAVNSNSRDFIIAIDAGHGGEDPGAIGHLGTREKDVALKIARELKCIINNNRGFRGFLIRDGDYYIGLRDRMQRARTQNADLFISIHADAFTSPRVVGSSVFILSKGGASSEAARRLAEKENRADLVGGVSLGNKGNILASVLLDLSQTANEDASLEAASHVLRSLGQVTTLHKRYVERAGFAVLKAPDMPSILIETGFISNPNSEKALRSVGHQRQIARNIMAGVQRYFATKPKRVMPTAVAMSKSQPKPQGLYYIVKKGDTLGLVANKHKVSIQSLRLVNKLNRDCIMAQQKLIIPTKLN